MHQADYSACYSDYKKYNLKVKYKKGKEMFLADTLSQAYLTGVHVCSFS